MPHAPQRTPQRCCDAHSGLLFTPSALLAGVRQYSAAFADSPMRPRTPRTERQARRRPNLLAELPDDLLVRVLEGLSATNLCYACMSCKRLQQLEAQHQEALWCALATERWAPQHLERWPTLGAHEPLSLTRLRARRPWLLLLPWAPRSATDRAGWKHRFAYLRAGKSGSTRDAMSQWIVAKFEFELVLRSGQVRVG